MKLKRINGQVVLVKDSLIFRFAIAVGTLTLLALSITVMVLPRLPDSAGFFESVAGLC